MQWYYWLEPPQEARRAEQLPEQVARARQGHHQHHQYQYLHCLVRWQIPPGADS